jgi:predicted dehydrogenase/threonine dehydrogenase-like Zn-dependent dehydrogenase
MLMEFGKANLIGKALQQPDKVRMVLDKARTDGLLPTLDAIRNKLDQPLAMGYCNVGRVLHVGESVDGFHAGDRVVSNGKHAEIVCAPQNLCARVPGGVGDDEAAFTVLGAIALQGIRLVQPTLGECVVVTGLGLIGLLTVQLLHAHGCRVLGIDFDAGKCELARRFGAEAINLSEASDPLAFARVFSRDRGVDAVIITASTASNEPVHQAAQICRKRGRIVLVGVAGLELSRADFFEKELSFQVSCSYGPGRYDANYEEKGRDYPVGFVRWTEQRNFEAVLDMMADRRLDVRPLISHRYAIEDAVSAYALLGEAEALGILLDYPDTQTRSDSAVCTSRVVLTDKSLSIAAGNAFAFIGSGNYAGSVLIPAFRKTSARLKTVVSYAGVSGVHAARKYGFDIAATTPLEVLTDPEIVAVVVATRHDSHAKYVCDALMAGKHVFVEKPLCLTHDGLAAIEAACAASGKMLCTGFNRRFSPHLQRMKMLLAAMREPMHMVMSVNAGAVPQGHWTRDPVAGGGRIIGECCHFIDALRFLAGDRIAHVQAAKLAGSADESVTFTLCFENGSVGTVHYLANGHKSFPKERLEVFCGGRILQLDNFRRLTAYGWPGFNKMNLWRQDKGQTQLAAAFVEAVHTGAQSPIPLDEQIEVTRISFDIAEAVNA